MEAVVVDYLFALGEREESGACDGFQPRRH